LKESTQIGLFFHEHFLSINILFLGLRF